MGSAHLYHLCPCKATARLCLSHLWSGLQGCPQLHLQRGGPPHPGLCVLGVGSTSQRAPGTSGESAVVCCKDCMQVLARLGHKVEGRTGLAHPEVQEGLSEAVHLPPDPVRGVAHSSLLLHSPSSPVPKPPQQQAALRSQGENGAAPLLLLCQRCASLERNPGQHRCLFITTWVQTLPVQTFLHITSPNST